MAVARCIGKNEYGGPKRHSPETQRAKYDCGERQAFTSVASATSAVGNRHSASANHKNHIWEVINDNNEHPAFAAIASRLEQLAIRQ